MTPTSDIFWVKNTPVGSIYVQKQKKETTFAVSCLRVGTKPTINGISTEFATLYTYYH